ncbi:MAG: TldD/PmbA family protein [Planctomycetota bacterium]|nr:TldD/PmbA family protein [Planctomycetota bacterium]
MIDQLEARFKEIVPDVDHCSLRYQSEHGESIAVRQDVLQPVSDHTDAGVMITVAHAGGLGYAATSDLTTSGLAEAARRAQAWAARSAGRSVTDFSAVDYGEAHGEYIPTIAAPWNGLPLADRIDTIRQQCARLKADDRIVDWYAAVAHTEGESLYLNNKGARIHQAFHWMVPIMSVTANQGGETQTRTLGGYGLGRQGGTEILDEVGFHTAAPRLASEAIELLSAPDCPTGAMDLLLMPDQMILQIHESIGHPIELDRILGDERNYAGTSFVTLDMFGKYRYGSDLLNVTFDPGRSDQLASYGFDDEGCKAERTFIIEKGILKRPLGGTTSQARAGVEGVANARSSSWNRPPIDRMANLNLEPGDSTLEDMVAGVENGILMATNCSWSIDDSRNKFQFGCEYGRRIENGELTQVVRKSNYRGVSSTFWRNLAKVGNESTLQVMGTPNCGKGEPNQMVRVGHASPACLFSNVDVFGGA